jgi:hypothetical protein
VFAARRRDLRLDVALIDVRLDLESRLTKKGRGVVYPYRPAGQKPSARRPGV